MNTSSLSSAARLDYRHQLGFSEPYWNFPSLQSNDAQISSPLQTANRARRYRARLSGCVFTGITTYTPSSKPLDFKLPTVGKIDLHKINSSIRHESKTSDRFYNVMYTARWRKEQPCATMFSTLMKSTLKPTGPPKNAERTTETRTKT